MSDASPAKLVYLLWAPPATAAALDRAAARDVLLSVCAPKLLALGPAKLVAHVNDPESAMPSPSPFHPKNPGPICGQLDLWLEDPEGRGPYEEVLRKAGLEIAGYLVDESVYRDYGDNRHAAPRSWADGKRSPGVALITLLEKPARLEYDEWLRRWHGVMSPVSEEIQPRTRYVRNRVLRPLTPEAPPFAGMVVECWPSNRHVTDKFLFFGAGRNPLRLALNLARILRAVTRFHDLHRVRTTSAGEYFLKTGFSARSAA